MQLEIFGGGVVLFGGELRLVRFALDDSPQTRDLAHAVMKDA
jgi:hypothetical protein